MFITCPQNPTLKHLNYIFKWKCILRLVNVDWNRHFLFCFSFLHNVSVALKISSSSSEKPPFILQTVAPVIYSNFLLLFSSTFLLSVSSESLMWSLSVQSGQHWHLLAHVALLAASIISNAIWILITSGAHSLDNLSSSHMYIPHANVSVWAWSATCQCYNAASVHLSHCNGSSSWGWVQ